MSEWAAALEVGGTMLRVGLVDGDGKLVEHRETEREHNLTSQCRSELEAVLRYAEGTEASAVALGVAVAAPVRSGRPDITHSSSLREAWGTSDLIAELEAATGFSPAVINDANAATLAEGRVGAARGVASALICLLGTGLGGGVLLDGNLVLGRSGLAGEIGHMNVDPDGPECPCGSHGCLELYVSGTALGRDPETGAQVGAAITAEKARQGDEACRRLFAGAGRRLGAALAGLVNVLDLEMVVFGGGLIPAEDLWTAETRESLLAHLTASARSSPPRVEPSHLASRAGLVGAGLYALEEGGR